MLTRSSCAVVVVIVSSVVVAVCCCRCCGVSLLCLLCLYLAMLLLLVSYGCSWKHSSIMPVSSSNAMNSISRDDKSLLTRVSPRRVFVFFGCVLIRQRRRQRKHMAIPQTLHQNTSRPPRSPGNRLGACNASKRPPSSSIRLGFQPESENGRLTTEHYHTQQASQ